MLPTLSHLSVRSRPGSRLRHRRSPTYQRISPLHMEFRFPLRPSSSTVWKAFSGLSPELSPPTNRTAYVPSKPSDTEQRSRPLSYRGCWHRVSRRFLPRLCQGLRLFAADPFLTCDRSLQPEGLHPPRGVAGSGFRPLPKIPKAATRRCLGSVSVPVCPVSLSARVPVKALVSRYLTN